MRITQRFRSLCLLSLAALAPLSAACGSSDNTPATPSPDNYIVALQNTELFPGVSADTRDVWIKIGNSGCAQLKKDEADRAWHAVAKEIAYSSDHGWSADDLDGKVTAILDAATQNLCPEVSTG